MKKQTATDAEKAASNDKPENGKADRPRVTTSLRTLPPEPERYTVGSTETVKRGFLKEFCDFTRKKGTVNAAMLIAEFAGRPIDAQNRRCQGPPIHPLLCQQGAIQGCQLSECFGGPLALF
jgi:hypothetical protein